MVEIGEGTGALVVYTPAALLGDEIEIRPHQGAWTGLHTAVRARHLGTRVLHAGVFGSLPAGTYDLRVCHRWDAGVQQSVVVSAGAVVETTWHPDHGTS
jgi:hypothetical protein